MDQLQSSAPGARPSLSGSDSKSTIPLDRPSFTFIDHDDDLTSKRIRDVNARKAIRSHVMRDVRRRERLAGLKRTPKRENRAQHLPRESQCNATDQPEERRLVLRAASQSPLSPSAADTRSGHHPPAPNYHGGQPTKSAADHQLPLPSPYPRSLPTSWFMDPFCSLPGADELPSMVAHLVFYWKNVFVPMTFPRGFRESELVIRSAFSDPGSFFGLMSMCAAHRSALTIECLDDQSDSATGMNRNMDNSDYFIMKAKSIRELNAKVRDPKRALTNEAFDTIVNLINGSLIAGLFDEVRIHLTGLKRMVDLRGGITDESIRNSSILPAMLATDVKAGSGLMAKPVFPLVWDAQPVPSEIQQRLRPPVSSPALKLGSGFWANKLLSQTLLHTLSVLKDVIWYSIAIHATPETIRPSDHEHFVLVNFEVEHRLLSYVYSDNDETPNSSDSEMELHPIEMVTRVALICFINHFLIVTPPSSGLGRALSKHLMSAVNSCKLSFLLSLPKENLGLFAWTLFIGAQGSLGRPERPWFAERLARLAVICEWHTWEQVSKILCDYFFLPGAQGMTWQTIWDEATAGSVVSVDEI